MLAGGAIAVLIVAGIGVSLLIANSRNAGIETEVPAVPLTSYPGFQSFPSFSPEGTRVAFSWDEPGKRSSNVFVKLIGPSEPVRLTSSAEGDFGPAWPPDGRSIAFLRALDNNHASIMLIPAIGGQERELTRIGFDAGAFLGHWSWPVPPPFLAWSADGKWLLGLDQAGPGVLERHATIRVSVETGEKRSLISPARTINGDASLSLSPDGKTLAFTRTRAYWVSDIYIVRMSNDLLPSGEPERLTFDGKQIRGLCWTADGRYLVFSSTRGGRLELWQMAATPHATPVRLTAAGDDPSDPTHLTPRTSPGLRSRIRI
jgi:Tol biopolymer transport system component